MLYNGPLVRLPQKAWGLWRTDIAGRTLSASRSRHNPHSRHPQSPPGVGRSGADAAVYRDGVRPGLSLYRTAAGLCFSRWAGDVGGTPPHPTPRVSIARRTASDGTCARRGVGHAPAPGALPPGSGDTVCHDRPAGVGSSRVVDGYCHVSVNEHDVLASPDGDSPGAGGRPTTVGKVVGRHSEIRRPICITEAAKHAHCRFPDLL
jgi:hypothetical protein